MMGQKVDFWYKSDANFDFEQYIKTIKPDNEILQQSDSLLNENEPIY
jgi:hypothetical protein